jgi:hypothetical protein
LLVNSRYLQEKCILCPDNINKLVAPLQILNPTKMPEVLHPQKISSKLTNEQTLISIETQAMEHIPLQQGGGILTISFLKQYDKYLAPDTDNAQSGFDFNKNSASGLLKVIEIMLQKGFAKSLIISKNLSKRNT